MSTMLFLEIAMANVAIFAENKKLPSVDGTDGSEEMMEKRSGAASTWIRLLLLF